MDFDESYENVLRVEFENMRKKYEKQVEYLKEDLSNFKRERLIEKVSLESKIEELTSTKTTLSNRLM